MGVNKAIEATEEAIKPSCERAAMEHYTTAKQELGLNNSAPEVERKVSPKM